MRYRELATRPMAKWAIVAVGARLPVAMATLALVFLVRDRPGGYALGAGIAAVYVLGEVVGASVFGPRLKPDRVRKQLAAGLARPHRRARAQRLTVRAASARRRAHGCGGGRAVGASSGLGTGRR